MVINLTTSPQSITGSDTGIFIYPNEFMYAFGSVEPTVGTQWDFDRSKPFEYGGEHGLLWVWIDGTSSNSLPYSLANTPPKVALTDGEGKVIFADATGALSVNDELKIAIHSGDAYSFDLDGTIAATSSIFMLGITGDKQIHFDVMSGNFQKGGIRVWLYEAPTTTANGTAQTPVNMDFVSIKTSTLSVFMTPTITGTSYGVKKSSKYFPLTGGGANVSPAQGDIAGGRILKPNTKYLFRVENIDNSECIFGINFIWHDSEFIL